MEWTDQSEYVQIAKPTNRRRKQKHRHTEIENDESKFKATIQIVWHLRGLHNSKCRWGKCVWCAKQYTDWQETKNKNKNKLRNLTIENSLCVCKYWIVSSSYRAHQIFTFIEALTKIRQFYFHFRFEVCFYFHCNFNILNSEAFRW